MASDLCGLFETCQTAKKSYTKENEHSAGLNFLNTFSVTMLELQETKYTNDRVSVSLRVLLGFPVALAVFLELPSWKLEKSSRKISSKIFSISFARKVAISQRSKAYSRVSIPDCLSSNFRLEIFELNHRSKFWILKRFARMDNLHPRAGLFHTVQSP